MATDESSLTDFEYRIVDIAGPLATRVYNQHGHAKSAVTNWLYSHGGRAKSSIRDWEIEKHIQIRHVMRGEWKSNIREVFGLE